MIRSVADGRVRVVTLDRPERRNALTNEGLYDLADAVLDADEPVIYLEGAGDAFCAGADLDIVADLDRQAAYEFARRGQRVADAIAEYDGTTVAGVDGPARGGGVELALACDIRIATPAASFAENGVSLGLFGAWGGTARLPEIVGVGMAQDLLLSGRVIEAQAALQAGLVSRILDEPRAAAREIAAHEPVATRTIAKLVRDRSPKDVAQEREAKAFAELVGASDLANRNR
ncbi:MAG: enoyl-CoA hydratase/isomerase family protein [Salinirussus sp.]